MGKLTESCSLSGKGTVARLKNCLLSISACVHACVRACLVRHAKWLCLKAVSYPSVYYLEVWSSCVFSQ